MSNKVSEDEYKEITEEVYMEFSGDIGHLVRKLENKKYNCIQTMEMVLNVAMHIVLEYAPSKEGAIMLIKAVLENFENSHKEE